jgi:hypothetical protein
MRTSIVADVSPLGQKRRELPGPLRSCDGKGRQRVAAGLADVATIQRPRFLDCFQPLIELRKRPDGRDSFLRSPLQAASGASTVGEDRYVLTNAESG